MKFPTLFVLLFATFTTALSADSPATWRAGTATARVTPEEPLPMAGYAKRKDTPSEGTEQDLFVKALALEDSEGNPAVLVTSDLIGITAELRSRVEKAAGEKYHLPPAALLMNASHTHCGPAYFHDEARDYFEFLSNRIVALIGEALDARAPAHLRYSFAGCGIAMNRRTPTPNGFSNHPNPEGVVDHTVPVLSVTDAAGELRAVVFGYACHNTTMSFMKWMGDYAGHAQQYFEEDHPGATAMFMMGCGGDQNPYPRGFLHFTQKHGRELATAIERALETNQSNRYHQHPLEGPLRAVLETVDLEFTDDSGRDDLAYPVQVLQFGDDLALVALGSEVVIDYSLRLKEELSGRGPRIWVAGYSNIYDGYIPSKRVLLEGGYEAMSRPWKPEIEERIIKKTHSLFDQLNP